MIRQPLQVACSLAIFTISAVFVGCDTGSESASVQATIDSNLATPQGVFSAAQAAAQKKRYPTNPRMS